MSGDTKAKQDARYFNKCNITSITCKKSVILYSQIQNLKVGTFHASDYEQYEIVLYTRWNKRGFPTVISYNYKCYEKLSQIS